jgi:hypothetical protein
VEVSQEVIYTFLWKWGYFFIHKRIVSAVKKDSLVIGCHITRGCWCDIVMNVHPPAEDKSDSTTATFYKEHVFTQFLKKHMNIFLWDFNAKVGREDIFKPTFRNENLHEISNDTGVRVVNFATSKNVIVRSTVFPHCNIHKYIWTSPDGKTQIHHILRDKRWHSNVVDVHCFRGTDCNTDQYMMVAKVRYCQ